MSIPIPTDEQGLYDWAVKKWEVKKYGQALRAIDKFNPDPKRNPNLFQLKIFLLHESSKHKEAFELAQLYVGKDPEGLLTNHVAAILGHGYAKMNEFETSSDWYRRAAVLAKDNDKDNVLAAEYDRRADEQLFPPEGLHKTSNKQKPKKLKQKSGAQIAEGSQTTVAPEDPTAPVGQLDQPITQVEAPKPPSSGTVWQFSKTFVIDKVVAKGVYLGIMKNSVLELKVTLIQASSHHVNRFAELVSFRDGRIKNPHIVKVDTIVEAPNEMTLLVCESLTTIDSFFNTKMNLFLEKKGRKLTNDDKADWYKDIEIDLNRILHGVLLGLMTLFSMGFSCEDLINNIFVTTEANCEAKILPILSPQASSLKAQKSDLDQLKRKIRYLISLPFGDKFVDGKLYKLSIELEHLLDTFSPSLLNIVPGQWLLFQPLLWNRKDRFEFIQNLRFALKRGDIDEKQLNEVLKKREAYWDGEKIAITWPKRIKEPAFIEVFQFPIETGKIEEYKTPLDIQRYINAVHGHINDGEIQ